MAGAFQPPPDLPNGGPYPDGSPHVPRPRPLVVSALLWTSATEKERQHEATERDYDERTEGVVEGQEQRLLIDHTTQQHLSMGGWCESAPKLCGNGLEGTQRVLGADGGERLRLGQAGITHLLALLQERGQH